MKFDRTLRRAALALALVFLTSLTLYWVLPGRLSRVVLYFPHEISRSLVPEARYLPLGFDREQNAELLVNEILLGPARHDHLRLFPRGASFRTLMVREGRVYIDFRKETFLPDSDVLYSPVQALEVLERTLKDNIPGIIEVDLSVAGEPARSIHVDKG